MFGSAKKLHRSISYSRLLAELSKDLALYAAVTLTVTGVALASGGIRGVLTNKYVVRTLITILIIKALSESMNTVETTYDSVEDPE